MRDGLISADEACARLRAVGYAVAATKLDIYVSMPGGAIMDHLDIRNGRVQPERVKEVQLLRKMVK